MRRTRRRGGAGRGAAVRAGWGRPPRGVASSEVLPASHPYESIKVGRRCRLPTYITLRPALGNGQRPLVPVEVAEVEGQGRPNQNKRRDIP